MTMDELDALRDVSARIESSIKEVDGRRVLVPVIVGWRNYWQEPGDGFARDRKGLLWRICRDGDEIVKQRMPDHQFAG